MRLLLLTDIVAVGLAVVSAYYGRFVLGDGVMGNLNYPLFAVGLIAVWMGLLWIFRCYEPRLLGVGAEEFRRVLISTFALFGTIAIVSYSLKLELARGFIALALPLGALLLVVSRFAVRNWIHSMRRRGRLLHRILVIGDYSTASQLCEALTRDPNAGFAAVGVAVPKGQLPSSGTRPKVLSDAEGVMPAVQKFAIDTIAVTASPGIGPEYVRRLSWALEGSGVDLIVAPALTDIAGPRIAIRPVAGLPLMYVDEPTLSGWTRLVKRTIDIVGSISGLVLLSPFLIAVGLAIRVGSSGPVIFKQERVGSDGYVFTIWKFRTMRCEADAELEEVLASRGRSLEPLFKMDDDPRVTGIGRTLRRLSIDELPQLVNVLRGEMSLVGPRPQRREEVERYLDHEHRRLMIRPGMTGLWQVSGRSETSWEEAVRLDLYYVENWSLTLDLAILMRTMLAVWRGEGAY